MSARQILRNSEYLILVRTSVITSLTADESSALVVGFSIEARTRGADAYDAEPVCATPAPRLAVLICHSTLATLHISSPGQPILCLWVDSGQCTAATVAGFFLFP